MDILYRAGERLPNKYNSFFIVYKIIFWMGVKEFYNIF